MTGLSWALAINSFPPGFRLGLRLARNCLGSFEVVEDVDHQGIISFDAFEFGVSVIGFTDLEVGPVFTICFLVHVVQKLLIEFGGDHLVRFFGHFESEENQVPAPMSRIVLPLRLPMFSRTKLRKGKRWGFS